MNALLSGGELTSRHQQEALWSLLPETRTEDDYVVFITNALPRWRLDAWIYWLKQAIPFWKKGYPVKFLDVRASKPGSRETLRGADLIYVPGGNAYSLLRDMRYWGYDEELASFINEGKPYVGISAGAIILTSDLATAETLSEVLLRKSKLYGPFIWLYGDRKSPQDDTAERCRGLALVESDIMPDYRPWMKLSMMAFAQRRRRELLCLNSRQAVLYAGEQRHMVHGKGDPIFSTGKLDVPTLQSAQS